MELCWSWFELVVLACFLGFLGVPPKFQDGVLGSARTNVLRLGKHFHGFLKLWGEESIYRWTVAKRRHKKHLRLIKH